MQQNPSKQQKLTFHQVYQLTDVSEVYFGSFLSTFVALTYIRASACKVLEPNHAPFKFTAVVRAPYNPKELYKRWMEQMAAVLMHYSEKLWFILLYGTNTSERQKPTCDLCVAAATPTAALTSQR